MNDSLNEMYNVGKYILANRSKKKNKGSLLGLSGLKLLFSICSFVVELSEERGGEGRREEREIEEEEEKTEGNESCVSSGVNKCKLVQGSRGTI